MILFRCELRLINAKHNKFEQIIKKYPSYIKEDKGIFYYDLSNEIDIFFKHITENGWTRNPFYYKNMLQFDSYLVNDLFRLYSFYQKYLSELEIFRYIFDTLTVRNIESGMINSRYCFSEVCKPESTVFENKYGLYEMIKSEINNFSLIDDVPYFLKYD